MEKKCGSLYFFFFVIRVKRYEVVGNIFWDGWFLIKVGSKRFLYELLVKK